VVTNSWQCAQACSDTSYTIQGERQKVRTKHHEVGDCRDATAKALSERIFGWIFTLCNKLLRSLGGKVCLFVCVCVCMCVRVYVYLCVCVYVCVAIKETVFC